LNKALEDKYPDIKIVADDSFNWDMANVLAANEEFKAAVDIAGNHFSCVHRSLYRNCTSTPTAKGLGMPLWLSENASMSHDSGSGPIARAINRMYTGGQMTAY